MRMKKLLTIFCLVCAMQAMSVELGVYSGSLTVNGTFYSAERIYVLPGADANSLTCVVGEQVLVNIPASSISLSAQAVNANYAITNGGFEGTWSNGEPSGWHSFNTATGDYVSFVQNTDQFTRSTDKRPGSTGTQSALIQTKIVMGANANGNCTNGRINAGSLTATDASGNYNFSDPSGSGYNTPFVGNPDSLVFWAKYIPADKNPSNPINKARAHAVITTNARYQDPEATSYASVKIADAAVNYAATTSMGWQRISVPFTYYSVDPSLAAYMLITFTSNYEPGGGSSYSEGGLFDKTYHLDNVYLDDVEMIYNHGLKSLTMNGQKVSFTNRRAEVNHEYSESAYAFVATTDGKAAKAFIGYDTPNSRVYVYVVPDNYAQAKSCSVYTIQMTAPQIIIPTTTYAYEASTCENEPYSDDLFSNLTKEGTYTDTIPNAQGGDSIVTLTLLLLPTYRMEETMYFKTVDMIWHGKTIQNLPQREAPYLFYDSLHTAAGCDSVYVLKLYVSDLPVTYGEYVAKMCDGESVSFEGVTYSEAFEGDVHVSQPNIYGGDSIVHLTVRVAPNYSVDTYMTITQGEQATWEGWNLSTMPVGQAELNAWYYSIDDCDSIVVLHLTVSPQPVTTGLNPLPTHVEHAVYKTLFNGRIYIIRKEDETIYDILGNKIQ